MPEPRNYILSIIGRMENLFVWFKESFGRVYYLSIFSSVQFSRSLMSNSLQPHRLQRTRLPCLSPTPGACSNLCPSSQWCHPTISSSVVPFSSRLQSFPATGSFPKSWFFGNHSTWPKYWSFSFSINPSSEYSFPLGWTGWISLQSKGLSRVFSNTTVQKHQFFSTQLSLWSNAHIHTWLLENHRFD